MSSPVSQSNQDLGDTMEDASENNIIGGSLETEAARRNIPGFVSKLYRMVNDEPSNLIKWSPDGTTFIVARPEEFAREVLPRFFKHNNFSSFVRQLNMYGFHKVPHIQQGEMLTEPSSAWEFSNPNFKRGRFDLLLLVKRKTPNQEDGGTPTSVPNAPLGKQDVQAVLRELQLLRSQQDALRSDISNVQRENQMLWNETMAARERHLQQQQVIEKILRFLASIFASDKHVKGNQAASAINRAKRQLLLEECPSGTTTQDASSMFVPPMGNAGRSIFEAPGDYNASRIFDFIDTTEGMGHDIDELQKRLDLGTLNDFMPALTETRSIGPSPKKRRPSPFESVPIDTNDFDISRFLVDDEQ